SGRHRLARTGRRAGGQHRRRRRARPRRGGLPAMSSMVGDHVAAVWDAEIVPALERYIRIPNVSPDYDAEWEDHGHMDEAVQLVVDWCSARPIRGLTVDVQRLPGRTPLVICEVPASDGSLADRTVL